MIPATLRLALATLGAILLSVVVVAQPAGRPTLVQAGQGDTARLHFRNLGRAVDDLGALGMVPYQHNPVIAGKNLYAPSCVDIGEGWYVYTGGWRDARDENDRIYLCGTPDYGLRDKYTPTNVVIDNGFYVHACDPSVVRLNEKTWVMAMTVFRDRDWIAISLSQDGLKWSPNTFRDRAHEVRLTNAKVSAAARPALLYNHAKARWEMYFDATVDGKRGFYLAYCEDKVPRDFVVQGPVADAAWADADVKFFGGRYFAAYRRPEKDEFPWVIRWADSKDGRWFTERGMLLEPDPLNGFDDLGVTNPGLAVDKDGMLRAVMYGGTTVKTVNNHKVGVAYPQFLAEAVSGTVGHTHRQAPDPASQTLELYRHAAADTVRIVGPGRRNLAELSGRFPRGATFDFRD